MRKTNNVRTGTENEFYCCYLLMTGTVLYSTTVYVKLINRQFGNSFMNKKKKK